MTTPKHQPAAAFSQLGGGQGIMRATAVCLLLLPVASLGRAGKSAWGETFQVENARYRVVVSRDNGAVTQILDKVGDLDLINEPRLADNFKFTLPLPGQAAWQATEANYLAGIDQRLTSCNVVGARVALRWDGPLVSVFGQRYDVSASMTIQLTDEEIRFSLKIDNRTPYEIGEVYFPILGGSQGLGHQAQQRQQTELILPTGAGSESSKIFHTFANHSWLGVHGAEQYYSYPDQLSMPWMEIYQASLNRGVSIAAHDPVARLKVMHLEMLPGIAPQRQDGNWPRTEELGGAAAGVKMAVVHIPYEAPGRTFEPSPVVLRFHTGGWQEAAQSYGSWFASQFDLNVARQGWLERRSAFQDCCDVAYRDLPERAESAAKFGITGLLLTNWKAGGQTNGVPRYEPDAHWGTREELAQAIARCHDLGVKVAFLVNLQTASQDHDWYRDELQQYACRDRWGIVYSRMEGGGGVVPAEWYTRGVRRVWLNPGAARFRTILVGQITELAKLGADGVYLQDFFARPLDFNPATGRTADRASWEGGLACLRELSTAGRAVNPDFSITVDSAWDHILPITQSLAVASSRQSALQAAFPSWRPTFTVAAGDEYWSMNDALRCGGRLRIVPVAGQPLGTGDTRDLAGYLRVALGVRAALSQTLIDGQPLASGDLRVEPTTALSTFRHAETGLRTAVLVNAKPRDIDLVLHGFADPHDHQVLVWQPQMGVQEVVLPATIRIPGDQFAIVTEEPAKDRLDAIGTWQPSARSGTCRVIFAFRTSDDLAGWSLEGGAFSVSSVPALFRRTTCNSLGTAGELATGVARSPTFTIDTQDDALQFLFQGGISRKVDGCENLAIRFIESSSGAMLRELVPPGTHVLTKQQVSVRDLRGRQVQIELVDRNTGSSFAWIGIQDVVLTRQGPK